MMCPNTTDQQQDMHVAPGVTQPEGHKGVKNEQLWLKYTAATFGGPRVREMMASVATATFSHTPHLSSLIEHSMSKTLIGRMDKHKADKLISGWIFFCTILQWYFCVLLH